MQENLNSSLAFAPSYCRFPIQSYFAYGGKIFSKTKCCNVQLNILYINFSTQILLMNDKTRTHPDTGYPDFFS